MPLPLLNERLDGLSGGCHIWMDSPDMVLGYGYGVLLSVGSSHGEAAGAVNAVFFGHRPKRSCFYLMIACPNSAPAASCRIHRRSIGLQSRTLSPLMWSRVLSSKSSTYHGLRPLQHARSLWHRRSIDLDWGSEFADRHGINR